MSKDGWGTPETTNSGQAAVRKEESDWVDRKPCVRAGGPPHSRFRKLASVPSVGIENTLYAATSSCLPLPLLVHSSNVLLVILLSYSISEGFHKNIYRATNRRVHNRPHTRPHLTPIDSGPTSVRPIKTASFTESIAENTAANERDQVDPRHA